MLSPLPTVAFTFVGLCAIALFALVSWVGPLRGKLGVLRGHGGHLDLEKRIRIHGNFTEHAPLVALMLLVAELAGIGAGWLWLSVALFFVGRAVHYLRYDAADRALGMVLSTGPAMALGVLLLITLHTS